MSRKLVFSRLLLLVFGAVSIASAQNPASAPLTDKLPIDPKVTVGTLPNGLRYYIRENPKPEKRAELRLVVNAGSIQEDDDQLGLAHFVEHTAFNGTTNFKKNELVSYLESIGVRFGADLNASTNFDETIYILPVPTDTARIVEKAFQILEDWAHGQIFDSTEVVNERGVVVEEWRGRQGSGERMLRQWLPVIFAGSKYSTRIPIGTKESIEGATPSRLRRFYRDWYRPDLMAVVAVGDFNKADIEAQIKKHFSGLTKPATVRPRVTATVPDNVAPIVAVATDKEATSTDVNLIYKLPLEQTRTLGDYRRSLMEQLYLGMLNSRFDEMTNKPNAPFLGAGGSKGSFWSRDKEAFFLGAGVNDGEVEKGLEALLVEAKRVDQFGFLQTELDREKASMLRGYERMYAERAKSSSGAFVEEYIGNFLHEEAIPGIEYEYELAKRFLPTITLAEVNTLAKNWITDNNRVILVQTPDKAGVAVPSKASLLAVFDKASKATVAAYTETVASDALLDPLPAAGRVVSESKQPEINITEWKLSNGARVLVKPTDFKDDEVLFSAYSYGGSSLAPDADFMSASQASVVVGGLSGVGKFNRIDLGKKLAGKAASVAPSIGETDEGLSGRASPKDIETLFQLAHLYFTQPRIDLEAFAAAKQQMVPYFANKGSDPDAVYSDSLQVTMAQHHFRRRPLTQAVFDEINPEKSLAFYKDRFADASDFTFVFVGNVQLETLKPLVERYIASLPNLGRKETFKDIGVRSPTGMVEKVVKKGTEPKAQTDIFITGPFVYNVDNRVAILGLTELFQIKLNETLREQLGGTYSPSVGASYSRIPRPEYSINVSYGSSPENVDKLSKSVFALIDTLKNTLPSVTDVDKVKEQILRGREVSLKQNSYWLSTIRSRDQSGEPIAGAAGPYDALVRALTPAKIQEAARKYLDTRNVVKMVLLPEK